MSTLLERAKEENAVAIYFELQACGYYSGAEYQEDIVILLEDYKDGIAAGYINADIDDDYEISVGELDGKHSNVDGTVSVTFLSKDNLMKDLGESCKDSNYLKYELFNGNTSKCEELEKKFEDYYESLEHLVEVKVSIPKSKVEQLREYAKTLCEE